MTKWQLSDCVSPSVVEACAWTACALQETPLSPPQEVSLDCWVGVPAPFVGFTAPVILLQVPSSQNSIRSPLSSLQSSSPGSSKEASRTGGHSGGFKSSLHAQGKSILLVEF